mgnify:CR=1 FL=1
MFGSEKQEWSTFTKAIHTCWPMAMGEYGFAELPAGSA